MKNKNKKFFVYETTNLKNGKFYIGVHETYNIDDGYLGSGKVLRNSIHYHGKENFKREVLEFCENKKQMYEKEKEIVTEELIKNQKCMNLVLGGIGFINDKKHRKISRLGGKAYGEKLKNNIEFRDKISKIRSLKAREGHEKGSYVNKNYATFLNKKHTKKTKQKMIKSHTGKGIGSTNSQYNTCWITNGISSRKINLDELNNYLKNDWVRGRTLY